MNDLDEFFAASAKSVEPRLDAAVTAADIESERLAEAVRWSLFGGGKRFRPALLFATGEALGVPRETLLSTAAAVEMIHTYSLIHDDLPAMDNDDLRRGRETCHKKFDEATAILAGDCLHVLAFAAIAGDGELAAESRLALLTSLSKAARKMVVGQQLDLEAEGKASTIEAVDKIHANKTGALISFSVTAAGTVARLDQSAASGLTRFADRLGLLFQISDDILDVTEATATLGKTAAKDLSSGKATYPSVLGIEGAKAALRKIYDRTIADLDKIGGDTALLRQIANFVVKRKF